MCIRPVTSLQRILYSLLRAVLNDNPQPGYGNEEAHAAGDDLAWSSGVQLPFIGNTQKTGPPRFPEAALLFRVERRVKLSAFSNYWATGA